MRSYTGAWNLARGVIQFSERRKLAVSIIVMLAATLVVAICSRQFSSEMRNTFLVEFILVPLWALLWVRCSIARAFRGVVRALVPDKVVCDGLLSVFVVLADLWLTHRRPGHDGHARQFDHCAWAHQRGDE